jgi:hypothetical protein
MIIPMKELTPIPIPNRNKNHIQKIQLHSFPETHHTSVINHILRLFCLKTIALKNVTWSLWAEVVAAPTSTSLSADAQVSAYPPFWSPRDSGRSVSARSREWEVTCGVPLASLPLPVQHLQNVMLCTDVMNKIDTLIR